MTDYIPPVPNAETVERDLAAILSSDTTATEKALTVFTWGARGPFFWNGNKRTSLVLADKILLQAEAGMLTITEKHMKQFNEQLLDYYNTGEMEPLKHFMYDTAIQGIEL